MECDGTKSCSDGSDEHAGCSLSCNGFLCSNKSHCIARGQYCDTTTDCADGSDEPEDCTELGPKESGPSGNSAKATKEAVILLMGVLGMGQFI